jgi:hypothetical protein
MSYTYLPSTPFSSRPIIIMTVLPASRKTSHLVSNPRVALLVHDWVSHRPPTLGSGSADGQLSASPPPSGLASLLYNLNTASLSRISVSLNGMARVLQEGSEEEAWHQARHKEHNTFGDLNAMDSPGVFGQQDESTGGAGAYIEAQEGLTVVVDIQDGRISDWKGAVRDFTVGANATGLVNGV